MKGNYILHSLALILDCGKEAEYDWGHRRRNSNMTLEEMKEKVEQDLRDVHLEVIKSGFPLEHFTLISKYVQAEIALSLIILRRDQLLRDQDGPIQ